MSRFLLVAALIAFSVAPLSAADKETRLFELRIYTAAKGKLDNLNARFRDHTLRLFEKHGMTNIGYWTPIDNPDERLVYMIAHKDMASRNASFKNFVADPEWKKAAADSEKDGKILARIDEFFLTATDYSPPIAASKKDGARVFELRTYITPPNGVGAINARFRDHTVKLFEKHGMTNFGYWNLASTEKSKCEKVLRACSPFEKNAAECDGQAEAKGMTLIYMLAHESQDAAKKSFDGFRQDADWIKARTESEKAAGGSLTVKDGVKSLFLKPTDYSPTK